MYMNFCIVLAKTRRCPHLQERFGFDAIHLFLPFGGYYGFNKKFNTALSDQEVPYFYIVPSTLSVEEGM